MTQHHLLVLLCVLFVDILTAQTPEEQARQAAIYVAARQYDRALDIYRALPQDKLSDWQRATLLFNIGTVLVDQQRWEAAVQALEQVPMADDSSPLLRRRGYYNLAVALLGLAKSQMYLHTIDDPSFLDKARSLGVVLQRAWNALDKAEEAGCQLQHIEGSSVCQTFLDITEARQRTKQLQRDLYNIQRQNRFSDLSFGAKVSRLLIILGAIERELGSSSAVDEVMPDLQALHQLRPFWSILKADVMVEHLSDRYLQSRRELLDNASTQYEEGLAALDHGDLLVGRNRLKVAGYWLRALLELESSDEMEALFKVQIMANVLGDNPPEFTQALDTLTKQWLKPHLWLLPAGDSLLSDQITSNTNHPERALLLYRIAIRRFGAIIADLLQLQPLNLPRIQEQLAAIQQYALSEATAEQGKAFQNVLDALSKAASADQVRDALQAFAIAWDLSGFLQEQISNLLEAYLLAVAHQDLSASSFDRLGTQLEQLKHFVELPEVGKMTGAAGSALADNIGNAMADHTLGIKALEGHQAAVARIFFGEVTYWLGAAERAGLSTAPGLPEPLMQSAVGEEQHAMQVVSSVMELPEELRQVTSAFAVPLHEAMRLAQKQALTAATPFVGAVLAHQRQVFDAEGSQDRSCQRYPWDEVLPLYFLGEAAAEKAWENLAGAVTSLSLVLSDQKVAYRKWLKALEMLQEGKAKAASAKKQTPEKPEAAPGTQMLSTSIDDILRQLQQMYREDSIEQRGQQSVQGGGGKPW